MEQAFSNNMTGIACTDEATVWNRGTKKNVMPASLENIASGNEQGPEINGAVQALAFETHEDYVEHVKNSPLAGLMSIPGTLLQQELSSLHQLSARCCLPLSGTTAIRTSAPSPKAALPVGTYTPTS